MRAWLGSLGRERLLEIAVAVAIGSAAVALAESVGELLTSVLAQHVGRNPFDDADVGDLSGALNAPYLLNFNVGGTTIFYGQVLTAAAALGLVALAAWYVVRRRDRELGLCPLCASRIPHDSTHCAYCGSGVAPGEP